MKAARKPVKGVRPFGRASDPDPTCPQRRGAGTQPTPTVTPGETRTVPGSTSERGLPCWQSSTETRHKRIEQSARCVSLPREDAAGFFRGPPPGGLRSTGRGAGSLPHAPEPVRSGVCRVPLSGRPGRGGDEAPRLRLEYPTGRPLADRYTEPSGRPSSTLQAAAGRFKPGVRLHDVAATFTTGEQKRGEPT